MGRPVTYRENAKSLPPAPAVWRPYFIVGLCLILIECVAIGVVHHLPATAAREFCATLRAAPRPWILDAEPASFSAHLRWLSLVIRPLSGLNM